MCRHRKRPEDPGKDRTTRRATIVAAAAAVARLIMDLVDKWRS
ncbi:hypothetical protein ACGFJC_39285 [Nonomuraea fuscirosea]|jgi:hypothetical protein|nr:hypothetical protein [Nonomuraea fuscirosea]WSA58061.1 hypothetical protein OIE67_26575 [Nonomuraea fuscirosea]